MNTDQAATIRNRAGRQIQNDFCSCHITAEELMALASALLDAQEALREIAEQAHQGLLQCEPCHWERESHRLAAIKALAQGKWFIRT